jgi:hypothetical protein
MLILHLSQLTRSLQYPALKDRIHFPTHKNPTFDFLMGFLASSSLNRETFNLTNMPFANRGQLRKRMNHIDILQLFAGRPRSHLLQIRDPGSDRQR